MNKSLYIIKLGGSAITDKNTPYTAKVDVIKRLAKEIVKSGKKNLIISHGSGSFGHTSAIKFGGKKGYKSKIGIATVCSDASRINQIVTDIFVKEGLPIISFSPRSLIRSSAGKMSGNHFQVIEEVFDQGLIPVVYGDVIWDEEWKSTIFSGEKVISEIATYLKNKNYKIIRIIQVGETDGVYDLNHKTISSIDSSNINNLENYFEKNKFDVTGGMKHKVENAFELAKIGIDTQIISAKTSNNLFNTLKYNKNSGTQITL